MAKGGFGGWLGKFGALLNAGIIVALLVLAGLSCIPAGNWFGFGVCFGLAGFLGGTPGGGLLAKVGAAVGADK